MRSLVHIVLILFLGLATTMLQFQEAVENEGLNLTSVTEFSLESDWEDLGNDEDNDNEMGSPLLTFGMLHSATVLPLPTSRSIPAPLSFTSFYQSIDPDRAQRPPMFLA